MKAVFYIHGRTHRGAVRDINEDHILLGRFIKNSGEMSLILSRDDDFLQKNGLLLAAADGIGGESAGEIASSCALQAFERFFYEHAAFAPSAPELREIIMNAGHFANNEILKMAAAEPEKSGMGCTLSGVCLNRWGYLVFNAGDSRVYRFRDGILKPLSSDDTVTNQAVLSGQMDFREAETSDHRHTLTNSMGVPSFMFTVSPGPELRAGDILLICSDGLHDLVDDDMLETLIHREKDMEKAACALEQLALENGGADNISIILAELRGISGDDPSTYAHCAKNDQKPE